MKDYAIEKNLVVIMLRLNLYIYLYSKLIKITFFINIYINVQDDKIELSQPEYIKEICDGITNKTNSPANEYHMAAGEDDPLSETESRKFK